MTHWTLDQIPDLTGKTALVTGANSGIGLETARVLAARGATVILGCRNQARAEAALAQIRASAPDARLEFLQIDLSDLDSVRAAAGQVKARHPALDILCNNAGVMGHHSVQLTKQGFEVQFGTNHLGHFALTGLLLETLQAAPAARVVAVSSVAHRATRAMNLDDPAFERTRYWHFDAYAKSKLSNLSFALELNRRARAAGLALKACAAHPGYSATNITSGTNQAHSKVKDFVVGIGNSLIGMSPPRGALPTLFAATSEDLAGGEFVGPDGWFELWGSPAIQTPAALARDPELAAKLWQRSEAWCGVRFLSE
jgi:NAD(P)-dependent dehydrogenase (short-subunit alcohol dehydrogenase family)